MSARAIKVIGDSLERETDPNERARLGAAYIALIASRGVERLWIVVFVQSILIGLLIGGVL